MVVVSETSITEEGETLIFKAADEGGSITMVDAAVSGVEEEVEEILGVEEVDTTGGEVDTNLNKYRQLNDINVSL